MKDLLYKKSIAAFDFGSEAHMETLHEFCDIDYGITLPIGVSDDNNVAEYPILGLKDIHGLLLGAPGTGVTNTLEALLGSLGTIYSCDELQIIYAEFNHQNADYLSVNWMTAPKEYVEKHNLDALIPNIAMMCNCHTPAKKMAFLDDMNVMLQQRILWLRENSMLGFKAHRGLPRVLVVIDNAFPCMQDVPDLGRKLQEILRMCHVAGMHFLFTGNTVNSKDNYDMIVKQYITLHICLRMTAVSASSVSCSQAANIASKYGVCVTTSSTTPGVLSVYQPPLVRERSLYKAFCNATVRYRCKAEDTSDYLRLAKA